MRLQFHPAARWLELAILLLAIAIRLKGASRHGISTDEEITWFAVRGVLETGMPRMPSGWVYDRGLLYTYASAVPAGVLGESMMLNRAVAVVFSVAAVAVVMALTRRVTSSPVAMLMAGSIVAVSPFHAQHGALARFYEPLLLMYSLSLLVAIDAGSRCSKLILVSVCACLTRLSHELAWTGLLIFPAVVLANRSTKYWTPRAIAVPVFWAAAGLLVGEMIVRAVSHGPFAAPLMSSYRGIFGSVVVATPNWNLAVIVPWWLPLATLAAALVAGIHEVRGRTARAPLAIGIVAAGAFAAAGQIGIAALIVLVCMMAWPQQAPQLLRTGLIVCAVSFVAWMFAVRLLADAPFASLARQLWWQSTEFPWRGVRHMFASATALSIASLLALGLGICGRLVSPGIYAAAVFWLLWTLLLGMTLQSLADRFMLIPLVAATIVGAALAASPLRRRSAIALAVFAVIIFEDAARSRQQPPVATSDLSPVAESIAFADANTVLVCNNPLAIRMYVRPCDLWFVPAPAAPTDAVGTDSGPIHRFDGAPLVGSIDEIVARAGRQRAIAIVLVESGSSSLVDPDELLDQLQAAGRPGLVHRITPATVTLDVPPIE